MMLLDSQALLWLLDDSPRLGPRARTAITEATRVYVSAATVWELTFKAMLGKLVIPARFSERILAQGLFLMAITAEDAEAIREYPELAKHDPFDRLIVAQAANARLQLVTADRVLLGLGRNFLIDAGK
ncbi:MAG TPA: type II toxin-antitoxin system VapC family toxin [Candidatus Limnocylindrales bacterium]